jgi:trans-L-3-hydroxyproline dehydratase
LIENAQVTSVRFHNVASWVLALDQMIEVPDLGQVRYDIAFGGAFYAFVQAADVGLTCTPGDFRQLIEKGTAIKRAIMASRPIPHPFEEDLSFLYGTIFVGPPLAAGAHSRNVCIFAEGEVDRCPTGTGVSGRLAIRRARGEIDVDEPMVVESIIGSRFTGRIVETTTLGPYPAIIPEVRGTAHITGRHEFLIDPSDPLRHGFILR